MKNLQKQNNKSSQELVGQVLNPFLTIQNEVDKAVNSFYDLFESNAFGLKGFENLNLAPSMDLIEDANSYTLEVEMPGMDEKNITLSVKDNLLTIQGEKNTSKKDTQKNYITREINYGRYERCITLPQAANGDKISASFKKGILTITIPKKPENKGNGHQIKIEKAE